MPKASILSLCHLEALTDDFGIWQHTLGTRIDSQHGYALDDSVRALSVALRFARPDLAETYLRFLESACSAAKIANFFGPDRQALPVPATDDALGEAYWALGDCLAQGFEPERAGAVRARIRELIVAGRWPRGWSYALVGAGQDSELSSQLAERLLALYRREASEQWPWIEDRLTYANAIVPLALLCAARQGDLPEAREAGLGMLRFLNGVSDCGGVPCPIGNRGWFLRGGSQARFDQQAIDPSYQVLANVEAWKLTGEAEFAEQARFFFGWFWGDNLLGLPLADTQDDSCRDGLNEDGLSANRGAESIICYLLAQDAVSELPAPAQELPDSSAAPQAARQG